MWASVPPRCADLFAPRVALLRCGHPLSGTSARSGSRLWSQHRGLRNFRAEGAQTRSTARRTQFTSQRAHNRSVADDAAGATGPGRYERLAQKLLKRAGQPPMDLPPSNAERSAKLS